MLYEEDSASWNVSKTINVSDCMKLSKKLSVNNEQIAKLVKVKEHTKTWIKNVEKAAKIRNALVHHPTVNFDRVVHYNGNNDVELIVSPSMYPLVLPWQHSCTFCKQPVVAGVAQYHNTLSHAYVMLCSACSANTR